MALGDPKVYDDVDGLNLQNTPRPHTSADAQCERPGSPMHLDYVTPHLHLPYLGIYLKNHLSGDSLSFKVERNDNFRTYVLFSH